MRGLSLLAHCAFLLIGVAGYTCESYYDCVGEQVCDLASVPCPRGYYCPGYTHEDGVLLSGSIVKKCPKGKYCPTTTSYENCPEGKFCPAGTYDPIDCNPLSICHEGASKQDSTPAVVLAFCIIVVVIVVFAFYIRIRNFFRRRRDRIRTGKLTNLALLDGQSDGSLSFLKEKAVRLDVHFENVSYKLPNGKTILHNISGHIMSGRVTAILGTSGAGKTTLMDLLSGKLEKTEGTMWINGMEDSLTRHRRYFGYVPQDNTILPLMSVKEALRHSAFCRVDRGSENRFVVNDVLHTLNLYHCRHTRIGDVTHPGISGGERKRANIGLEIVADPSVLFLDEPTTGLDSASANEVMECLRKVADTGTAVLAIVHQPRYEILEMFDDIMILGQGGYCVYFGRSSHVLRHFQSLGFKCEDHENPADMFLDVVSGIRSNKNGKAFTPYELYEKWQKRNVEMNCQMREIVKDYQKEKQNSESGLVIIPPRERVPFMGRFMQHFRRAYIQFFRDYERLFLSIFIHLLAGTVLGFSFSNNDEGLYTPGLHSSLVPFCPEIIADRCKNEPINYKDIRVMLFFTCMALNSASIIAAIPFFGLEKVTYFREAPLGFGSSAYFLAKVVAALPLCGLNSFIYISSFYATACPNGRFASYFVIVFLMDLCGTALGYALSFLLTVSNAFVLSVVIAAASSVFCGAFPTLKEANKKFGMFRHLWDLNFDRWASEAIYITEVTAYKGEQDSKAAFTNTDFDKGNFGMDLGILIAMYFTLLVMSYLTLILKNRRLRR